MASVDTENLEIIFEEILGDIQEKECIEEDHTFLAAQKNGNKLNDLIIHSALTSLMNDMALPQEIRKRIAFHNNNSQAFSRLREALTFMDGCITKRGLFTPALRQTSLQRFHSELTTRSGHVDLTTTVKCPQTASWIAFTVFEHLMDANFKNVDANQTLSDVTLGQDEREIVAYIGGSVVRKLRQRTIMNTFDPSIRRYITELLNDLADREKENDLSSKADMISILNRGGLSRPRPNMLYAFETMEVTFRQMFPDSKPMEEHSFLSECLKNEQITCGFYESVGGVECPVELKETLLKEILKLQQVQEEDRRVQEEECNCWKGRSVTENFEVETK